MKNLKARTKFCKKFGRAPLKIADEISAIVMNGKIVDIGRKGSMNGKKVRIAFVSDAQRDFFISRQERFGKPLEYYGRMKDDIYFIWGWNQYTYRGSALMIRQKYKQNDTRLAGEMMKDNCFTGKHRSGDQRNITAAIKIPAKFNKGRN